MTADLPADGASALFREGGLPEIQAAIRAEGLDGWLLFDFHGQNPVAAALLGLGKTTRRSFALIPSEGEPELLLHAIEHSSWRHWPWRKRSYSGWRQMEEALGQLVADRPRLALETSARSAVPTLDLVPAGIAELLRAAGVEPASSGTLVSAFHSRWTGEQLEVHRETAVTVAAVARDAFAFAADGARSGRPRAEGEVSAWIHAELAARGVGCDVDCIVAIGPRAADPHYHPGSEGEPIRRGDLLLIDLWGRPSPRDVAADQTWMGYMGAELPESARPVWEAVRDARDAALRFLRERAAAGQEVRGFEVDDVCRALIAGRGYGDRFVHRTGHSIDRDMHGSGPNLDNLETRDDRKLIPGIAFSVEPGIYLPDVLGVRSEVNVFWSDSGPEVTTPEPQDEVFLLLEE
jgi:Xaa-Pro dipeptidase